MQAMIRIAPPQAAQISMSMSIPNTRLRRCAQVIAARLSAGVRSSGSAVVVCGPPFPRLPGVTRARYLVRAGRGWLILRVANSSARDGVPRGR
jgi:hypothetical protein